MSAALTTTWLSQDFLADPYPHYRALRESAPVHYDEAGRKWILTGYHDVLTVLRDDVRFTAEQAIAGSMLVSDPPRHTRLRALVSKPFTPRAVREMAPRITRIVDDLLDAAADGDARSSGGMDVIAQFAYPLPITVIAEMLGVEPERRDFFREASQKIAVALGPIVDPRVAQRANEGRAELIAYFDELIAKRRREPRDDLITQLLHAEDDEGALTHGELLGMLLLLLIGGHETTVNLIANGLLAMLRHREQFELLVSTPGIEAQAVEELLRYDAPVQYTGRIARNDVELSGARIRAGTPVRLILAAANRDPAVFNDPDTLDLTRSPNPHLSFGMGIHSCLGGPLARVEAEIAVPALVRRFPNMRLSDAPLRWRPASVLRGLEELRVTFR